MKVGSLVECIDNSRFTDLVKLKTPYTVREILVPRQIVNSIGVIGIIIAEACIRLEEVNPTVHAFGTSFPDMPFPMNRFKELLPPIENIEEEINANIKETELV